MSMCVAEDCKRTLYGVHACLFAIEHLRLIEETIQPGWLFFLRFEFQWQHEEAAVEVVPKVWLVVNVNRAECQK